MSSTVPDAELKARHRAMWASGDYAAMVETWISPLGERLVEAAGIEPGMRVLDVAAGSGNASLPAARRGARVTASDLTPELLEEGRRRAEAAGVELDWVQGDAEQLPFADGEFDVVVSCVGAMFAPRHQAAADELVRVCRPGGTVALLSWTPEGMIGALFRVSARSPHRPRPAPSRRRCGAARTTCASCSATGSTSACWSAGSSRSRPSPIPRDHAEHFRAQYGPTIAARANAQKTGREEEFDAALDGFSEEWNRGTDGAARYEKEYLLAVATRR